MKQTIRLITVFVVLSAWPYFAIASQTVNAVWKSQEVEFHYIGLETAYSCETMEARVKMLLRHLGAAKDIKVSMPPCMANDRPQKRFRIKVEFSTLVTAQEGNADIIKAKWREVTLGKNRPRVIDDGDCELMERFSRYVLPAIEHEVIEGKTQCGATTHILTGRLKLKVLSPITDSNA
jgi:hypothetical protein